MSWPGHVLRRFARVPAAASEAGFVGPYNILLCVLFPSNTGLVVAPRWPPSGSPKSPFMYEILYGVDPDKSVLQLNAPGNLRHRSKREASDRRIRTSMTNLSVRYYPSHRVS